MAKAPAPAGPDALAAAYDAFAARLYATARRLVGTDADAEECVHDVFAAFAERPAVTAIDDLRAYLFASVRHAAQARSRQGRRLAALHLHSAPVSPNVPADEGHGLAGALRQLPFDQREVLALKVDGELTFAEIAQVLGINANTAASRYRYALAHLRTILDEEEKR